jgi:hypothetical protein
MYAAFYVLNSQCLLYLVKSLFCLVEEAKYNGRAEFTIAWLIHLKNLLESDHIDVVTEIDIVTLGLGLLAIVLDSQSGSSPPSPRLATFWL